MSRNPPPYRWDNGHLSITVKIQPRAAANAWNGLNGDHFRVRIAAPPVDGKANDELVSFIATLFGVSRSRVELVSGDSARIKRIRILNPTKLPPDIAPHKSL